MRLGKAVGVIASMLPLLGALNSALAADSVSLEFGTGNKTKMARLGVQSKWAKRWWQGNGTHIGGYWDLTIAQWRGTVYQGKDGSTQNLTSFGITPVFRMENDSQLGFYAEAGIGAHYLTGHYNNNGRQLSTNFEFGDHLGFGYVFRNKLDLGLKLQHFSNGGIKHPNSGVNFAVVRLSYPF